MTTQDKFSNEKQKLLEQIGRDVRSIDRKVGQILEEIEEYRERIGGTYDTSWGLDELYRNNEDY